MKGTNDSVAHAFVLNATMTDLINVDAVSRTSFLFMRFLLS